VGCHLAPDILQRPCYREILLAARFLRTNADIPQPKVFRDNFIKPFSESITAACRKSTTAFICLSVAVYVDI
jgi:hypothetical protein